MATTSQGARVTVRSELREAKAQLLGIEAYAGRQLDAYRAGRAGEEDLVRALRRVESACAQGRAAITTVEIP